MHKAESGKAALSHIVKCRVGGLYKLPAGIYWGYVSAKGKSFAALADIASLLYDFDGRCRA